ncbi:inosose dehydratase [Paenibacillus sp. PDC88]|nr:inosose dehydratase [Paenibacillus sp. PDC88]
MDVLEVIRRHRNRIVHVHFKDYDENTREWRTMGQGTLPHSEAVSLLRDAGYEGWIMVEEESAYAKAKPEAATRQNAEYLELCFTEFAKG